MENLLKVSDIERIYSLGCWQKVIFDEFRASLESESRKFPCVFGVAGFKADRLRFAFFDNITAELLAPVLRSYLSQARHIGPMTSLAVFTRPDTVGSLDDYRTRFWQLLKNLSDIDESERPQGISSNMDDSTWEFCFAGEPIFVVCTSPAHVLRQSRRSSSFMITFQPRWVFEGITDSDEPSTKRSLAKVRELLTAYDMIPPSPTLGFYGEPDNREYTQYFLDEKNEYPACPFSQLGRSHPSEIQES